MFTGIVEELGEVVRLDWHSDGAVIAVTIQPADRGDTDSGVETVLTALDELDDVQPAGPDDDREIVADKGYHSTDRVNDWDAIGLRTYISEPNRGRRRWQRQPAMREAVYRNRRAFVGLGDSGSCGAAANILSARTPICMKPARCAAPICVGTPTS